MVAPLILDLTRTLGRAGRTAPTGIDRVELAWARHLLGRDDRPVRFGFVWRDRLRAIEPGMARALVHAVAEDWHHDGTNPRALRLAGRIRTTAWFRREADLLRAATGTVWLTLSHAKLHLRAPFERLRGAGIGLVALVHDLIPLAFPEYARPGEAERHRARIATLAACATGLLCNSAATERELLAALPPSSQDLPRCVLRLGLDTLPLPEAEPGPAGHLLAVGTIEARKNHAFLLAVLRGLAESRPDPPRLVLVGARGWEAEAAIDLIERSARLAPLLTEAGRVSEAELATLYAGAAALLLPSFAEGYGLPLVEALAAGCPCVVSDLPALREVGGTIPEYLDPLDGPAWAQAMLEYTTPGHPRRHGQLQRLAGFRPPGWEEHFEAGLAFLDEVAGRAVSRG